MSRWQEIRPRFRRLAPVARVFAWMPARVALCVGAIALVALFGLQPAATNGGEAKGRPQAPDLEGGIDWLNVKNPLKLGDLKGRIVVLDFWTLCCINCIHTLPDLAKLEAKYPGVLVVIGVHTPKFENEKKTESIRKAILRYEVKHPVVNDADHKIWRRYGVRSWPTVGVIDAEGKVVQGFSGEGNFERLDRLIEQLVKEAKDKKILKEDKIDFQLVKEREDTPLFFPGKVIADQASNRLFIADSTHHRIVITDLAGQKIDVAGTGVEGFKNGSFDSAQFSDPQGMALDGTTLIVADRKNHSLRALDLKARTVTTIAGTGEQDSGNRFRGGAALTTGLNSPWDVLWQNKKLYIAMAGHHQIWSYDPAKKFVAPYAGDGREDLGDGELPDSSFAQPSGLATDGKNIYVADSEISAIRSVPLDPKGEVKTLVGEGLFEFGDVDGKGPQVRLQHALGVAHKDGKLYIADTYNSKLKILDPATRECKTYLGGGDTKLFNEPAGLSFAGDKLYVADTNNHRIQVVDVKTKQTTTLPLTGVTPPARAKK
jgi:DNA-binding beta-propeller fold protein YncE